MKTKKNIIKNNGSKYFWNKIEPLNPKINNIDKKKLYIFSLDIKKIKNNEIVEVAKKMILFENNIFDNL